MSVSNRIYLDFPPAFGYEYKERYAKATYLKTFDMWQLKNKRINQERFDELQEIPITDRQDVTHYRFNTLKLRGLIPIYGSYIAYQKYKGLQMIKATDPKDIAYRNLHIARIGLEFMPFLGAIILCIIDLFATIHGYATLKRDCLASRNQKRNSDVQLT